MTQGLLIQHQGEDTTAIRVVDIDTPVADINLILFANLSTWVCPPTGKYQLRHEYCDGEPTIVYIEYYDDNRTWCDDCDGIFTLTEVDVDICS